MIEKRSCPRIERKVPLKLSDSDEYDLLTETTNISASGAYFPINKPLALMTKYDIIILVPITKNKIKSIKKINCCGVVVRIIKSDDDNKYPYRAAIYFCDMKDSDRKSLKSYVNVLTQ